MNYISADLMYLRIGQLLRPREFPLSNENTFKLWEVLFSEVVPSMPVLICDSDDEQVFWTAHGLLLVEHSTENCGAYYQNISYCAASTKWEWKYVHGNAVNGCWQWGHKRPEYTAPDCPDWLIQLKPW